MKSGLVVELGLVEYAAAWELQRRIVAARHALADPNHARTPVSAIAYQMGFGSVGPFNRAFKSATGLTPTEWRRKSLIGSPNS